MNGNPGEENQNGSPRTPSDNRKAGAADYVSKALRSVYDDTLREDIPKELRDLLGKLD